MGKKDYRVFFGGILVEGEDGDVERGQKFLRRNHPDFGLLSGSREREKFVAFSAREANSLGGR